MRIKITGSGRARLFNLPPEPSAMAFSYLGRPSLSEAQPDCALNDIPVSEANEKGFQNIGAETSRDSDDVRRFRDLEPNISSDMTVPSNQVCGLGPQDVHEQEDFSEMDWTGKEICIKCNKGGELLVCNDNGCAVVVHEKCIGCSAQFDDMGNFCCPYCLYKRAITETRQLREKAMLAKKALSTFLDKEMIDGSQQKKKSKKTRTANRKELTRSTVAGNVNCCDGENRLESNDVHNQSAQVAEDRQEEGFAPLCATSTLPCKETDVLLVNKKNDVLLTNKPQCGDNAGQNDCDHHRMTEQTHLEPIIACGGDGVCCREEGTAQQFQIVEVGKRVQAGDPREVDDHHNEKVVEAQQEAGHLSASPIQEETALNGALKASTKRKSNDAGIFEESEFRTEEEHMQEPPRETTVSLTSSEPALEVHSTSGREVETSDSISRNSETASKRQKHGKQKDKHIEQPQNVDSPRRSSRKLSSGLVTSAGKNGKVINCGKSRELEEPSKQPAIPSFPTARRKKLLWRDEEEEMIKEGVQKFSTTVNKNLPWRKILDFGRHVFDATRTPVDLKDKWRNILAKECSTK